MIELCCTDYLLDLEVFRKVYFWFRCSRVPGCANIRIYSGFQVRPTDLRMCGQARCQGRFRKSVSFLVSRNAYMRRDPCYNHLGLRWNLFKKVVKAFHIFSFKCFTPQAFDCGQAVGVNNKIIKFCGRVKKFFRDRRLPSSSALKTEEPSLKRVVLGLSGSLVKNAAAATLCSLFEPSV